jgi:hypothetical protein
MDINDRGKAMELFNQLDHFERVAKDINLGRWTATYWPEGATGADLASSVVGVLDEGEVQSATKVMLAGMVKVKIDECYRQITAIGIPINQPSPARIAAMLAAPTETQS